MRKKKFVFSAIAVVFAAGLLLNVYDVSTARSMNMEQRFANLSSEKLSKKEQSGDYSFDKAHSYIGFKVKHMGLIDVPGSFTEFKGDVDFDAENVKASSVEFTAETKSVNTRVNARDNHLRSKDFFEVETYPEMKFKSTSVSKKGKRLFVTGDLTMKDVTKEITIPFRIYGPIKDARGTVRMGIVGSTGINRRDFNVNYGGDLPDGTAVLSDMVIVDLQIESVKKKEEPAQAAN